MHLDEELVAILAVYVGVFVHRLHTCNIHMCIRAILLVLVWFVQWIGRGSLNFLIRVCFL